MTRSVVRESFALSSSRKSPIFGRQRACARLATGALEEFVTEPPAAIYKRAAGALAVFAADPLSLLYK
ncbi:hypothetical protein DVK07_00535 [Halorubrum sp. Atlit-26R]|nr:hypothetical protein DVK07_00535 [Halorubrum sp. Atlit-26R]